MQSCLNLSNIISRDSCVESLIGTSSPGAVAGLATLAAIIAAAIFATLAAKHL